MKENKKLAKKRRARGVFSSNLDRERERFAEGFSLENCLGKAVCLENRLVKSFIRLGAIPSLMKDFSQQKQRALREMGMKTEEIGAKSKQLETTSDCFGTLFKFILFLSNSSNFPPNSELFSLSYFCVIREAKHSPALPDSTQEESYKGKTIRCDVKW